MRNEKPLVKQLFLIMQVALWILWPVTALAAQRTFALSLYSPDMMLDLMITAGIGVLVGFSSILTQMQREYETNGRIDRLWLFVSSKMSASLVSALAMYFAADWMELSRSPTVGAIIVVSFSGRMFIEQAGIWLKDKFFPAAKAPS